MWRTSVGAGGPVTLRDNITTTGPLGVNISATQITLDGLEIHAGGSGSVRMNAPTVLTADAVINTAGGNITFEKMLNGDVTHTRGLMLSAGSGGVTFNGLVGNLPNAVLGPVMIQSAAKVDVNADFKSLSFTVTADAYDSSGVTVDTAPAGSGKGGDILIKTTGTIFAGGLTTSGGNILLDTGAPLTVVAPISAGDGNVGLIVHGDIKQTATGTIAAFGLGIRQLSAATGDILLDEENSVFELASFNTFSGGMVTYRNAMSLALAEVSIVGKSGITFASTTGVTTNNGDVLLDVGGSLDIEQQVATGTANVRLIAHGDIGQSPTGIILANQLGVRQEGPSGNVLLDDENAVNIFAAANLAPTGMVTYHDVDDLTVGTVAGVTKGLRTFTATSGIQTNNGDVLLDVGNRVTNLNGGLVIAGPIVTGPGPAATTGDVRLIVRGDLSQTAPITADLLGIRQQNATLGNVLLDGPNAVNELAATNLWLTGMITYHDVDDLTVGSVPGVTKGLSTFNVTTGVTTNNGDVLLDVGGSLDIEQQVATGTANVRLIAHGDIGQSPTGIILANQLGVRQEGPSGNVLLDDENAVNIFAAANLAPTGMVTYHDVDDLTVGTVAGVTKGLRTFTATSGIQTNNGDVLLDVGNRVTNLNGGLVIAGPIVTGPGPAATTGDVRLIVRGDLSQRRDYGRPARHPAAECDPRQRALGRPECRERIGRHESLADGHDHLPRRG